MAKITSKPGSTYTYSQERFYEKPVLKYLVAIMILATFIVSLFSLINTYQLKKSLVPGTVSMGDFLKKLTTHDEMKPLVGVSPLNIIQITNNNFASLQSQIRGLDTSYIGKFIVQYTDRIIVYDYEKDQIIGAVSLQQPKQGEVPVDFFSKLNNHRELKGLEKQQPVGGQLNEESLATLKQQFPEVYSNAKVGDFLLRYQTKLIIYDYNADRIVNAVDLK